MKRKQLMQLPVMQFPAHLTDRMENTVRVQKETYKQLRHNYYYSAITDRSTGETIMILDLFKPSGKHIFRYFVSKDDKYFTVFDCDESKISSESIWHIFTYGIVGGLYSQWYNNIFYPVDDKTEKCIFEFLGKGTPEKNGMDRVYDHSKKLIKNRLEKKHNKIRQSINDEMLGVRPMPKRVEKWMNDVLMKNSQYLFYDNNGRKMTNGWCTCCQKEVDLIRPKHKSNGRCPSCRKTVQFYSRQMFNRCGIISDRKTFAWMQKTSAGFVIRNHEVSRKHIWGFETIKTETSEWESSRAFYVYDEKNGEYQCKNSYELGGVAGWRHINYSSRIDEKLCPVGINEIIKHRNFKCWYIDFVKLANMCDSLRVSNLMKANYVDYPLLAQLINAKLSNLAMWFVGSNYQHKDVDRTAKTIHSAFGMDKEIISKIVIPLNPDISQLELIKTATQRKDKSDLSDYRYLFDYIGNSNYRSEIKNLLQCMTIHRLTSYIQKQKANTKHFARYDKLEDCWRRQNFFRDYLDYLRNCEVLGLDISCDSVRFPKNFISAHDHAAAEIKVLEDKKKQELFEKIETYEAEYNESYYFEDRKLGLLIRAPRDQKEIGDEGTALHHCVATYRERVAKKMTIILFIRKIDDPDTPYFTLNLDPIDRRIIQCRGVQNCSYPSDVKEFMDKWHKEKVENINKENRIRIGA